MAKKITGIALILIGSVPLFMRVPRMFGGGPNMLGRSAGGPGGNFPSGAMPPSGMPIGGGPRGGGMLFGILGTLGPYLIVIGIIFIVIGVILLTHKEKKNKAKH